ncbi:MAG: hemolysin family protein [Elusimicrobia bacterium]|nr:hemolysin family protein [Elusimicrobiota bacterium]
MIFFVVKIALFFIFLLLIAFFAGMETALTSLSSISLRRIREEHPRLADIFLHWQEHPNEYISTMMVVTNVAMIGATVAVTAVLLDTIELFQWPHLITLTAGPLAAVAVILLLGEIIPKISGRYASERVAVKGIWIVAACNRHLGGVNRMLVRIAEKIISLAGQRLSKEPAFLHPDELKFLLSSEQTLPLPKSTRQLMRNILRFSKTRISHVMVPKASMHAVNLDQPFEAVIEQIIEKQYSRVPVYRGNIDNIVGIIYSRDLALAWRGGALFLVEDLIRPAYFVPNTARVDTVLREFKNGHHHLAIVVDEFGSTVGEATIEDIVEEIVGEIWDEYDIQEKTIIPQPDGATLVRAGESLAAVNDQMKLNLPAQDFATVSGWMLDMFGRIPRAGETIRWGDIEIEIVDADKKKIMRVKIRKIS